MTIEPKNPIPQPITAEVLARLAYDGYCASSNYRSLISGAALPDFSQVDAAIRGAWQTAGLAVAKSLYERLRADAVEAAHQLATSTIETMEMHTGSGTPSAEELAEWAEEIPTVYALCQARMAAHAAVLDAVTELDALFAQAEQAAQEGGV